MTRTTYDRTSTDVMAEWRARVKEQLRLVKKKKKKSVLHDNSVRLDVQK